MQNLTWVELSKEALMENISRFRDIVGPDVLLSPCVKANAYGHGLNETARIFLEGGCDWLCVNATYEAASLRSSGIDCPIYILGYVGNNQLEDAVKLDCRVVVYNKETVDKLFKVCSFLQKQAKVHLKVETGNNRQGIDPEYLVDFALYIKNKGNIEIEGLATHFANIEDTTDHTYAFKQLDRFNKAISSLEEAGIHVPIKHCANSAATLLFKETHFNLVRPGIATYGMWPSKETYVSYAGEIGDGFKLSPAFTWKTKIAQIKTIPAGEFIGYGCTYKTSHDTKLAILPVGYYDGYDRGVNGGHVLIKGKRAPIRGRICMNIMMVEVTDIEDITVEDEVVLIGCSGDEKISAEQFGAWAGTINYEVTTRVNECIPRIVK